jgi:DNA processing protein
MNALSAESTKAAQYFTLLTLPSHGPVRVERLVSATGDVESAFESVVNNPSEFGLSGLSIVRTSRAIEDEILGAAANGIDLISTTSLRYPPNLNKSKFRRRFVFMAGDRRPIGARCVAVIGTSSPTAAGEDAVSEVVSQLVGQGLSVISGLARGIDGQAHKSALEAQIQTHAVLGTGLGTVYPPEHRQLYESVLAQGSGISHFLPSFPGARWSFPERNKVMAGCSLATILMESRRGSGSLLQAENCISDQRPLFIHSSNLENHENEEWINHLVGSGATVFSRWDEIASQIDLGVAEQYLPDPLW